MMITDEILDNVYNETSIIKRGWAILTFQNPDQAKIFQYLQDAKRIAVVGLSNKPERTSYRVTEFMQEEGYEIIPVNPVLAGQTILGETVFGTLQEVPGEIDIVNVFRRSEFLPAVASDMLETDAKIFWAQLGIENEEAAQMLESADRNEIVMNRCIMVERMKMTS